MYVVVWLCEDDSWILEYAVDGKGLGGWMIGWE